MQIQFSFFALSNFVLFIHNAVPTISYNAFNFHSNWDRTCVHTYAIKFVKSLEHLSLYSISETNKCLRSEGTPKILNGIHCIPLLFC